MIRNFAELQEAELLRQRNEPNSDDLTRVVQQARREAFEEAAEIAFGFSDPCAAFIGWEIKAKARQCTG